MPPTFPVPFVPMQPTPAVLFHEQRNLTYSHAPMSFDLSDIQSDCPSAGGGVIPFSTSEDDSDPLTGFLRQSTSGVKQTEAERKGADRYGANWPMIRAQRFHSGDRHVVDTIMRATYAQTRIGSIFTPLEVPQNPDLLYADNPDPHNPSGRTRGLHGIV